MKLRKLIPWLLLPAALGISVAAQHLYDSRTNYYAPQKTFVNVPRSLTAEALSFGHRNLAADFYFIWAVQFYSSYHLENRFDYIERIFNLITDLGPSYREVYVIGALIMAFEKGDVEMALRLLEKGSRANNEEWLFDYEAAFYCQKMLQDLDRAAFYLDRASRRKSAPPFLKRKEAHLVYLKGDLESSWKMWSQIYDNPGNSEERDIAFNHLYQIKAELDLGKLREKISEFFKSRGRYPRDLGELVTAGLIRQVPADLGGAQYSYDADTGNVRPPRFFKWK